MNTVRNIVLAAAAVAAMVVAAPGYGRRRPDTTTGPRIRDSRPVRPAVPRRPGIPAAVLAEHAGMRVQVRPSHWDLAPGRRPISLTATLRLTTSAMLSYPNCP